MKRAANTTRFGLLAGFVAALLILISGGIRVGRVIAQEGTEDPSTHISAPQSGQTLIGVVTVQGTAANANFQRYRLEFSQQPPDGSAQWFPLAEVAQQVMNGSLAQWNTLNVPDGPYQIRLSVILRDGSVLQTVVHDLTVGNKGSTPLPTVGQPATSLPATLPPTEGPSPTPLIQQPPSLVPRPTVVTGPGIFPTATIAVGTSAESDTAAFAASFNALRNSFCVGIALGFVGFGLLLFYRLVYARFRLRLRRMWAELRMDR